eukprot:m.166976 g.166976  ORF g.166976 m.166976 type:complete len:75 (+) comp38921_c0_seq6:186-410(+)
MVLVKESPYSTTKRSLTNRKQLQFINQDKETALFAWSFYKLILPICRSVSNPARTESFDVKFFLSEKNEVFLSE